MIPEPLSPPSAAFDAEQREGVAGNPPGVSFTIALVDGQRRFVQGEPIRVELSFSSRRPATYRLDGARYDRRGRLQLDEYRVDPDEHVVDPLEDYFELELGICGGIRSMPVLGEAPERMIFEVNEWCRFDAPGRYRLFVRSARIQREDEGDDDDDDTATSNMLEFEVVPIDPASASRTVQAAVAALGDDRDDRARLAARRLRFLGTEEAAEAMVDNLRGDPFGLELVFGLVGSPHRAAIVRRMEARLVAAHTEISSIFLDTLALLRTAQDEVEDETYAEARQRRRARIGEYADRLAGALASKRAPARDAAIATLLQIAWELPPGLTPSPWFPATLAELPAAFARLPAAMQSDLLVHRWRRIAGPAMGPVLVGLLDDPRSPPNLRADALQRLLELAPELGRARILAAIGSAEELQFGVLAMKVLGALPDATLPELDDALARRLEESLFGGDLELAARLVARYATPGIVRRVAAVWSSVRDHQAVKLCAALLAYLLRADPGLGEREARRLRALADRRSHELLVRTAGFQHGPGLERVLLDMLDDPDPEVAAAAASALGMHGSAAVESRLWARLRRWHAQWEGRADELRHRRIEKNPHTLELRLEGALWQAIALGRAWLTGAVELERLAGLLVTAHPKEELERQLRAWRSGTTTIRMTRSDAGDVRISVAQYSLDSFAELYAKLAQFPRGTRFVWQAHGGLPQDFADVERFVAARGMTLGR